MFKVGDKVKVIRVDVVSDQKCSYKDFHGQKGTIIHIRHDGPYGLQPYEIHFNDKDMSLWCSQIVHSFEIKLPEDLFD